MRPNRFLAAQDSSSSTAPPRTIKSQGSNKSSSSNSSGKSKPMSMGRSSSWKSRSDEDALFDIEGFHESKSCEPFFESDEESSGMMFFILSILQIKSFILTSSPPVCKPTVYRGTQSGCEAWSMWARVYLFRIALLMVAS